MDLQIIKKDGTLEDYDEQKIINAVNKAARRDNYTFSDADYRLICDSVLDEIEEEDFEYGQIPVDFVHNTVEKTLLEHFPNVGEQYQQYRNYKLDFVAMMDDVYKESQKIMYIGDKENSNTDSALVSTKRSLIYNKLNREFYKNMAYEDVENEMRQGYQGWEYKFNTVASSRGDYPFITITFGLGTGRWEKLATKTILRVHREGQGKNGNKKPVLFPKLVFLYTDELHGIGKINEDLFEEGVQTSAKTMYPDWLSLDGDTPEAEMYHKYGKVISPMGKCKLAHVKHLQTNCLLGVA